jgi:hypothetical protein
MKRVKVYLILLCFFFSSLACTLTSPTPASWSGTPSAEAQDKTKTVTAQTAQALSEDIPTEIPLPDLAAENNPTSTPTSNVAMDGPWLVFPDPEGIGLQAYDVKAQASLEIDLPTPIYFSDLVEGRSPLGGALMIRAGSPENLDELALYQVNLPEAEVARISPLLSLQLQRQIVNAESSRALETLNAVTRGNGLSWSPNGRYIAFTAALDNASSDLYLFDTWQGQVRRLNGLYTHNGIPFWSPSGNWLISQEFDWLSTDAGWRTTNITALRVPGYDDQNTLYLPPQGSQMETLLGWVNDQNFLSYSQTPEGPQTIREVTLDAPKSVIRYEGPFLQAAFDPGSKFAALILGPNHAGKDGLTAGIYGFQPGESNPQLLRAGDFTQLAWDPGGMFIASGASGVFGFMPEGTGFFLPEEGQASLSPSGNWLIAWEEEQNPGARLYQPPVNVPLQTLLESPITDVVWQPDSRGFFILNDGTLDHFAFPSLNPNEVALGFSEDIPPLFLWLE